MILTAFFFNPEGDHRMSWQEPHAPRREIFDLDYYKQLAMAAESARMDAIFVVDHVAMWDTYESISSTIPGADAPAEPLQDLIAS
jgi:alkanesulfonate monooxygenase SsuD/methylene tetrahydromethanopterin reductase-like flavin-dependent oxidoreductase (luciferase family)